MTTRSRTGRLRKALLSRIFLLKTPLNYDYYHYLLLGGYPSARRVRLYQRNHSNSMQQQQQCMEHHQQPQPAERGKGEAPPSLLSRVLPGQAKADPPTLPDTAAAATVPREINPDNRVSISMPPTTTTTTAAVSTPNAMTTVHVSISAQTARGAFMASAAGDGAMAVASAALVTPNTHTNTTSGSNSAIIVPPSSAATTCSPALTSGQAAFLCCIPAARPFTSPSTGMPPPPPPPCNHPRPRYTLHPHHPHPHPPLQVCGTLLSLPPPHEGSSFPLAKLGAQAPLTAAALAAQQPSLAPPKAGPESEAAGPAPADQQREAGTILCPMQLPPPRVSGPSLSIEQLFEDPPLPLPPASPTDAAEFARSGSESGARSRPGAGALTESVGSVLLPFQSSGPIKGSSARGTLNAARLLTMSQRRGGLAKAAMAGASSSSVMTSLNHVFSAKALAFSCFSTTSSSSSVDPPFPRSKKSSSDSSSLGGSRSTSHTTPRQQLLGRRETGSGYSKKGVAGGVGVGTLTPQSGPAALKDHEPRLTEREKSEIKNFRMVYFLGQMAAKKSAMEEGTQNDCFDDKEGFYICKPHDHILYRYEIHELLGKGTFGQVVKALDHKTNMLVAMKIVKNERPFLRQAKEEVRILEVLRKQDKSDQLNIVHILDSFKWRGHACISFELLGISLHQLLKKTRGQGFSLSRIQRLCKGIVRCLEVLARNRIIHCDIKPENILLRRSASGISATQGMFSDNSIKVIDFGSSCYEQQQIYTYIQSRYYRAPEVIMGARYTCAIDMWSLACVIGELFTARPLFAGDDESDQLATMMEVLDIPPVSLISKCKRADKFFNGRTPRYLNQVNKRKLRGNPGSITLSSALKDTEDTVFLDFMQRALVWDPSYRLTAAEALRHPWILRGQSFSKSMGDTRTVTGDTSKSKISNVRLAGNNNTKSITATVSMSSTMGSSSRIQPFPTKLPVSKLTSNSKVINHLVRPRSESNQAGDGGSRSFHALSGGPSSAVLPAWESR